MQSHEYRAILLKAIDLFLENTPPSLIQAHLLIKDGKRSLASTTINFILWSKFFSELTDSDYFANRELLLEQQHHLLGVSRHSFQAYVGYNYTSAKSTSKEELQLFAILQEALHWLSSLQDAQREDDERYTKLQHTLLLYRSIYPFVDDVYSEQVAHFILRMVSSTVEHIKIPSLAFAEYGHLIAMPFSEIGVRDENEFPSLARDFAWALNALQALQGQSWISFHWQLLPANIILLVK